MAQFRSNLHHDPNVGEVPVPHGPETGEEYEQFPERRDYTEEEEREIFRHIIRPDDSFTENGTYWADLPWLQKAAFVNRINNQEAVKELKTIWAMMKKDPLSPIGWYLRNAVLPGAGLGLEGYVLFSIGNLSPLFADVWPQCWNTSTVNPVCAKNWIASVTYLEVIGIMVGQIGVGVSAVPSSPQCTAEGLTGLLACRLSGTGWVGDGG